MAFFLEDKGYSTYRGYPLISYKMAAQLAGLGVYGKNSLIVTPQFGPWVRFTVLLTTASLEEDLPAKEDLCGKCAKCIKACPLGALTPYKVDPDRCLVGIHLNDKVNEKLKELIDKYEPSLTSQSHLMCTACQKVCKIGTRGLK
jgi:epoxyqueuosine reductase QueG